MKTKQKLILTAIATMTLLSTQTVSNKIVFATEETPTVRLEATTDSGTGGNTSGTTDPGTGENTGGTTDPGTGGNTGETTDPDTGGNTSGTTDPGTGGNTGGTTDSGTGENTGGTTNPETGGNTEGGMDSTNDTVAPNTNKIKNPNTSEQVGMPVSGEQQNSTTSDGITPADQTSLLPKTSGEKTNIFELSFLSLVTSVIFITIMRLKIKKGGGVQ